MMVGHKSIQGRFSLSNFECQHIFFSPSVSLHLSIFTEAACINVTRLGHYILPSMIAMMANDVSTKSQRFAQRKGVGRS